MVHASVERALIMEKGVTSVTLDKVHQLCKFNLFS